MAYTLTNLEKETIILFNEAEDTARVETFNARILNQLRNVAECDGVICEEDRTGYGMYIIPKTMIKIHAPQKRKAMTEEKKAELREAMQKINAEKKKQRECV